MLKFTLGRNNEINGIGLANVNPVTNRDDGTVWVEVVNGRVTLYDLAGILPEEIFMKFRKYPGLRVDGHADLRSVAWWVFVAFMNIPS